MSSGPGPPDRVGPYEIVRPLGEGGFARTWEARHAVLGGRACLKVGLDPAHDDLLLREARILWDLHHPALPTLRGIHRTSDDRLAIAMRFVEGEPLSDLRPVELPTALRVFGRLLRALRVLHHRGVVHSDVKPANILVAPDRHGAVLVDFGVAAVRPTAWTKPTGFTETFCPPELLEGAPPIPESDLHALGLTLAHALGGDVASRVLPEAAPPDLGRFIAALTERDPADRPRWETHDILGRFDAIRRAHLPPKEDAPEGW